MEPSDRNLLSFDCSTNSTAQFVITLLDPAQLFVYMWLTRNCQWNSNWMHSTLPYISSYKSSSMVSTLPELCSQGKPKQMEAVHQLGESHVHRTPTSLVRVSPQCRILRACPTSDWSKTRAHSQPPRLHWPVADTSLLGCLDLKTCKEQIERFNCIEFRASFRYKWIWTRVCRLSAGRTPSTYQISYGWSGSSLRGGITN